MVKQRGKEFYLTRLSNIRNSAQYEQYTYKLWHEDETANVKDNPAVSYKLYSSKWSQYIVVKHNP